MITLNWTVLESGIEEARPCNTVRYFLVPDGDQWFACISTGMAYKVIRQLTPEGDTKDFAKSRCQRDWNLIISQEQGSQTPRDT